MNGGWASIGQRIQFRRERLGMSQAALAKVCGVYTTTVSKWERDEIKPTRNIVQLAAALHVHESWILTGCFELRATAEGRKRALTDVKDVLADVSLLCKELESMPVGQLLPRGALEVVFSRMLIASKKLRYAMQDLPDPGLGLRTEKEFEVELDKWVQGVGIVDYDGRAETKVGLGGREIPPMGIGYDQRTDTQVNWTNDAAPEERSNGPS